MTSIKNGVGFENIRGIKRLEMHEYFSTLQPIFLLILDLFFSLFRVTFVCRSQYAEIGYRNVMMII